MIDNLRDKTVFDLTDNEYVLNNLLGIEMDSVKYKKVTPIRSLILDFIDLYKITKDENLKTAIIKHFKKELELFKYD
jgi:hypothetical protein